MSTKQNQIPRGGAVMKQKLLVHRSDQLQVFEAKVDALLAAGWKPVGPVGVMNMPRFDLYQTFQLEQEDVT